MFKQVLQLQPNDAVAASLLATLEPRKPTSTAPAAATPPKPVPPDSIVGKWQASGSGNANYTMTLNMDGTFTWEFQKGSRKESAKGVFNVEGNVLAMELDAGGVMLAELTAESPDSLKFKMVGGQKGDPGLSFRKAG
jgi:hypothetical protein